MVEYVGASESIMKLAANANNTCHQEPIKSPIAGGDGYSEFDFTVDPKAAGALDAALDEGKGARGMPRPLQSFEGIANSIQGGFITPPDPVGDVGPKHYVQMVNLAFAIYDKNGRELVRPLPINALFQGIAECDNGGGDPIVLYDQLEDRWLLTQFTKTCRAGPRAPPCYNCMALSMTNDPTGSYYRYKIPAQPDPRRRWGSVFPDYPKYSVWSDSYILTTRDFGGGFPSYQGVSVYAIEKKPMLVGDTPRYIRQVRSRTQWRSLIGDGLHMQSADVDGNRLPPPNSPVPILSSQDDDFGAPFDAINVWEMSINWNVPSANLVFKESLPIAQMSSNVCGYCIEQVALPGGQKVDALPYLLLYRLAYRNFGSYESMVTVRGGVERRGPGSPLGVRWFEIRRRGGDYSVHQQGTYSPNDGHSRWIASIAQDRVGNIAMGYSVASRTLFPGIHYAGRRAGDDLNKMTLGEATLVDGSGTQSGSARFGDYSSMNIDPSDDCKFWFTAAYYAKSVFGQVNRGANWQTRIGSFELPGCRGKVDAATDVAAGERNDTITTRNLEEGRLRGNLNGNERNQILLME